MNIFAPIEIIFVFSIDTSAQHTSTPARIRQSGWAIGPLSNAKYIWICDLRSLHRVTTPSWYLKMDLYELTAVWICSARAIVLYLYVLHKRHNIEGEVKWQRFGRVCEKTKKKKKIRFFLLLHRIYILRRTILTMLDLAPFRSTWITYTIMNALRCDVHDILCECMLFDCAVNSWLTYAYMMLWWNDRTSTATHLPRWEYCDCEPAYSTYVRLQVECPIPRTNVHT